MTDPHDDEPAEWLRDAWQRALDVPTPLDADDEPADPTTAAAVDWTRRAWAAQAAPPVAPDVDALVARRRDGPPPAPSEAPARRRAPRLRDVAAAAALVLATLGPVAWLLERSGSPQTGVPTTLDLADAAAEPDESATATRGVVVPDVVIGDSRDGALELVSGPVRLVLLAP